jgi:hypothetical protein
LEAEVPPNTTAEVVAPGGVSFDGTPELTVGAGQHSFSGPIAEGCVGVG